MTRGRFLAALVGTAFGTAEDGFTPMFDGMGLEGWTVIPRKRGAGRWLVNGPTVTAEGQPGSLATVRRYGDFDLRMEWQVGPLGNTGVFYRVGEGTNPASTGIEFQLVDNARPASREHPDRQCGAAYGLYAPTVDAARPLGEWNSLRVLARGPRIEHWINGSKVLAFEIGSEDFRRRVAASKFANRPGFATARRGRIVLQDHGTPVSFRNIRVLVLD